MDSVLIPPFLKEAELVEEQKHRTHGYVLPVPNEPFVSEGDVRAYLLREVECKVLDELSPLFFVFAKRRASHIDALHEYDSTQRAVTISENPGLHLVRNYHVIYCKPIPLCLLNYDFWLKNLTPNQRVEDVKNPTKNLSIECKSAIGLIRTYCYLIKHESDFNIAKRVGLLPEHVSYDDFRYFIEPFRHMPDAAVSGRYEYGHIRLTRLNLAVRILRPKGLGKVFPWSYDRMHWHAGQFVGKFAAPLLFFFASLTLILSSMQVGLAAQPVGGRWDDFTAVSLWFSIAIIFGIIGVALLVCVGIGGYVVNRVFVGYFVYQRWLRSNKAHDDDDEK